MPPSDMSHLPPLPANIQRTFSLLCVRGTVYWTCRHCGSQNRRQVRATTWKAQCSNRECKRMTMFSAVHEDVPRGRNAWCPAYAFRAR